MPTSAATPLKLLSAAARSSRTAPRPHLLTADGRYDGRAIMALAHELARDDVADAARQGWARPYKIALRDALRSAWITAQSQRFCFQRDASAAALPASHAAILAERTAALMIDSDRRMVAELSAIDARAAAMGIRL